MSDAVRREMQDLLVRMKATGVTQRDIAAGAGVRQPLVSLAAKGRLVAATERVERLFEYLRSRVADLHDPVVRGRAWRDLDPRLLEAVARLSDGSPAGNTRLVGLLEAIAAMRPGGGD